jgi:hypothetical protein
MNTVLDEVISEELTAEHVSKRVDDWLIRLGKLYAQIESWLPPDWKVGQRRQMELDEDMMRRYGVGPREMPVFDLVAVDGRAATLEPRGLWIIGYNGRVDLFAGSRHFLIIDRAEIFGRPEWQITDFNDRQKAAKFDKARLSSALNG